MLAASMPLPSPLLSRLPAFFCSPQKVQCVFRQYLVKLLNWIGGLVKYESRAETLCFVRFFISFISFHCLSASSRNKRLRNAFTINISFPWSDRTNDMGDPIVNPIETHVKLLLLLHSAMLHQVRLGVVHRGGIGFATPAKTTPAARTFVVCALFKHIFVLLLRVRLPVLLPLLLLALALVLASVFAHLIVQTHSI